MVRKKNTVIRVTVYCLLIVFLIAIVNLQISMNELEDTIQSQKEEIVKLEDDIAEYEMLLNEEKDDAYYERRARLLNYHFRDEIVFYNDYAQ
ncbi:MAG: septum formation initiator family protein [Clostridia bacterium]|nr:septum formation initiator family protein [Clostridia bacterium]